MKNKKIAVIVLASLALFLSGCGENTDTYDQAVKDLEQGSYSYALSGYQKSIEEGVEVLYSCRGAGIACLRMGEYDYAIRYFTAALQSDKLTPTLRKDILSYRATTYLAMADYESAMADCQELFFAFGQDSDIAFLTGKTALFMNSYEEARREFDSAYSLAPGYETALRLYQTYLEKGMEADGTRYLEMALSSPAESAQDYCDRGRIYYYMEDYPKAAEELTVAVNKDNKDAVLLLGMVYLSEDQISNARAMYNQYISETSNPAKGYNGLALCDVADGNYNAALDNIAKGIPTANTEEMQSLLFNEITIYEKMYDFSTALAKCKEYTAMFPDDARAVKEQGFLESRVS